MTASLPSWSTVTTLGVPSGQWVRTLASRLSSTWRIRMRSPTISTGCRATRRTGHCGPTVVAVCTASAATPTSSTSSLSSGRPSSNLARRRRSSTRWPMRAVSLRMPVHHALEVVGARRRALLEQFCVGGDGGERGAQFVRCIRDELPHPALPSTRNSSSVASRWANALSMRPSMTLRARARRPTSVRASSPGTRSASSPRAMASAVPSTPATDGSSLSPATTPSRGRRPTAAPVTASSTPTRRSSVETVEPRGTPTSELPALVGPPVEDRCPYPVLPVVAVGPGAVKYTVCSPKSAALEAKPVMRAGSLGAAASSGSKPGWVDRHNTSSTNYGPRRRCRAAVRVAGCW